MSWFRRPSTTAPPVPLEQQLARLADNGVRLRPGVTPAHVARLPERGTLEAAGYRATLCALGAERRDAQGDSFYLSDDVWFFDSACIHGTGDYARVIARLAALLPVEFPAREASDSILLGDWRATVSFELDDTRHHWTQRVMEDWFDETLLVRINQLIDEQPASTLDSVRGLWQIPLENQHRLVVAATAVNGRRLAHGCGLAVRKII